MASHRIPAILSAAFLTATLACSRTETPASDTTAASQPPAASKKYVIAVIPQGSTHEFWKSIHAGAMKASQDLAASGTTVEVIWKGPLR